VSICCSRRSPANDAGHHLHHARAAARRKGRRGLSFFHGGGFFEAAAGGQFHRARDGYGNSYGILKSELLDKLRAGKDVLLNVDVQGAATIRAQAEKPSRNCAARW
jgi:guanylate kinase